MLVNLGFNSTNLHEFVIFFQGKSFAGKKLYLEIIPDRVEVLHEYPEISEANIRVKKVKKERVVSGWIDVRTPIGDDFKTQCKMLKKQGMTQLRI